jgi:hypothetical protein
MVRSRLVGNRWLVGCPESWRPGPLLAQATDACRALLRTKMALWPLSPPKALFHRCSTVPPIIFNPSFYSTSKGGPHPDSACPSFLTRSFY